MLDVHGITKMPPVVPCPMDFSSLPDQGQQGGILKLMKNGHFLVFLVVWVFLPKFLGRLRDGLC